MKKIVFVIMLGLVISLAAPVSALDLNGNVWMLSKQEVPVEKQVEQMYQADLTLIGIGPVRVMGGLEYAGESKDILRLYSLLRGKTEPADFVDHKGNLYMISGATGRVRVDWPLTNGLAVIGSVGHRFAGTLDKTDSEEGPVINSGVYSGPVYSGGLSLELLDGLHVSSIYEVGPSLKMLHGLEDTAKWRSWDVGLEYRIPFISAKAGYREQRLENESEANSFELGGFYIGAGIRF